MEGLTGKVQIPKCGLEERKRKAEGGGVDRKFLWGPWGRSIARKFI